MADVDLRLRRVRQPTQTLGLLSVYEADDLAWTCVTSELPWEGNQTRKSCIPPGHGRGPITYHVDHRSEAWSAYQYPHLIVRDVPNRTAILVHRGNFVSDTAGCILVGRKIVDIDGDGVSDITHSTETLEELLTYVPEEGADLHIRWMDVPDIRRLMQNEDGPDLNDMIADADLA